MTWVLRLIGLILCGIICFCRSVVLCRLQNHASVSSLRINVCNLARCNNIYKFCILGCVNNITACVLNSGPSQECISRMYRICRCIRLVLIASYFVRTLEDLVVKRRRLLIGYGYHMLLVGDGNLEIYSRLRINYAIRHYCSVSVNRFLFYRIGYRQMVNRLR